MTNSRVHDMTNYIRHNDAGLSLSTSTGLVANLRFKRLPSRTHSYIMTDIALEFLFSVIHVLISVYVLD